MSTIEIITSITGGKDALRDNQMKGGAKFICYSDDPELKSDTWEIRPAYDKFKDPRRNSRIHKILIHKYSTADVTIWMDGTVELVVPPEDIIEKFLGDWDLAMFAHGGRDCIYDEALECAKLKLDDPELLIEQAKYYEDNEFAKHKGLLSGYFIMRKNNQRVRDMNEFWWADYCRFSRRDQISLMPAIDKAGVRANNIPEGWKRHGGYAAMGGVMKMYYHLHREGNWNQ